MIKSFEVKNLNNKISDKFYLNEDLNILTGKNGCGKTTIMKTMWYFVSGNLDKLFEEVYFDFAKVEMTDGSSIEVEIRLNKKNNIKNIITTINKQNEGYSQEVVIPFENYEQLPRLFTSESSLFFPTFRRIEGGFSINTNRRFRRNTLRESLESISENLTNGFNHKFIASISTEDINYLLSNKYADISEEIRKLEVNQSGKILDIVANSEDREKESLELIRNLVKNNDKKRNDILKPFTMLSLVVHRIFKDKSIKISNNLELGEAKDAIFSDKLSAGEKQMLSFLCYNFFYDNSVIFIDEPELSLHTDWQRILFPTLLKQKKNNQFIIATHSPFIYAKYTDKEIIINEDKGTENGEY